MRSCRICKAHMQENQTFCLQCGARYASSKRATSGQSVLGQVKGFLQGLLRSEAKKLFDDSVELGRFGFEAAIPGMEEALALEPQNREFKSMLAVFYAQAGWERIRRVCERFERARGLSIEGLQFNAQYEAEPILRAVRSMIQAESSSTFEGLREACEAMDKALGGALEMFDRSFWLGTGYPGSEWGRAQAYRDVADSILMAHGIFPKRMIEFSETGTSLIEKGQRFCHGDVEFGISLRQGMSDFQFADEIVWLYNQAIDYYQGALRLDPTYTKCHLELSELLSQFGRQIEASDLLNKALSILNKAIQADNADKESILERAEIYRRLGETRIAISDLEHALSLETLEFRVRSIRDKLEVLGKRNV